MSEHSKPDYFELIYIFVGFLLGIISSSLAQFINWLTLRKKIRIGVTVELEYLCPQLAINVGLIIRKFQPLNDELTNWLIERCSIRKNDEKMATFIEMLNKNKSISTEDREKYFKAMQPIQDKQGTTFKKFRVDFLSENISDLTVLPKSEFSALISIKSKVEQLNEQIDYITKFFDMTFTTIDEGNHTKVTENVKKSEEAFGLMIKTVTDDVYNYLQKYC